MKNATVRGWDLEGWQAENADGLVPATHQDATVQGRGTQKRDCSATRYIKTRLLGDKTHKNATVRGVDLKRRQAENAESCVTEGQIHAKVQGQGKLKHATLRRHARERRDCRGTRHATTQPFGDGTSRDGRRRMRMVLSQRPTTHSDDSSCT